MHTILCIMTVISNVYVTFPYTIKTDGANVFKKVDLNYDLFLYGRTYRQLIIYSNGIVALETELKRVRQSTFISHPVIVPYWSKAYLTKVVHINVSRDEEQLKHFDSLVEKHYAGGEVFKAKEVLDVTWMTFTHFYNKSMQTTRMRIGNDGINTYMYVTYTADTSSFYELMQFHVYGDTMAIFSGGDKIRFKEIREASSHESYKNYLSVKSNMGTPGEWIYKLGGASINSFIISQPNAFEGKDINECEGVNECHTDAACVNVEFDYICKCNEGFIGNGRVCTLNANSILIRGKLNGNINGQVIDDADQTTFIDKETSKFTIRALPIEKPMGQIVLLLSDIFNVIGYLFAANGYNITGNYFSSSCVIEFLNESDSKIYVRQQFRGYSKIDYFQMDTKVIGQMPDFGQIKSIHKKKSREEYTMKKEGILLGTSSVQIDVNGKIYSLLVSRVIEYPPYLRETKIPHFQVDFDVEDFKYSIIQGVEMTFVPTVQLIEDESNFLLFVQSGTIKSVTHPYNGDQVKYLYTAYGDQLIGVDYDCSEEFIYFTDATTGQINRMKYDGLTTENVISGLTFPEGVSVDWLNRNIFWTDSGVQSISMASIDSSVKTLLFDANIQNPRSITVDVKNGKIYWTDWDRKNPRIEVATTTGSNREIFIDSTVVATPNGLTFNYELNELCWTDVDRHAIICATLDSLKTIRILTEKLLHPFALTLNGNELFWTDWKLRDIQELNLQEGKHGKIITGIANDGRLYDIKYVRKCPK